MDKIIVAVEDLVDGRLSAAEIDYSAEVGDVITLARMGDDGVMRDRMYFVNAVVKGGMK